MTVERVIRSDHTERGWVRVKSRMRGGAVFWF